MRITFPPRASRPRSADSARGSLWEGVVSFEPTGGNRYLEQRDELTPSRSASTRAVTIASRPSATTTTSPGSMFGAGCSKRPRSTGRDASTADIGVDVIQQRVSVVGVGTPPTTHLPYGAPRAERSTRRASGAKDTSPNSQSESTRPTHEDARSAEYLVPCWFLDALEPDYLQVNRAASPSHRFPRLSG
jgi:hypothetical protein